jgi:hypothetical protein
VYKTAEYILVHVVSEDGQEHPEWGNVTRKFGKMFNYYETTELAEVLGVKKAPALVYFPKSVAKKSVQKTIFTTKDTLEDISNEIDSLVEDFTVPLVNQV